MALPKFPTINQELLSQLRGLFFSKDNPIVLPNNGFIGLHSIDTPSQLPPFPYRFIYIKADGCVYILDYEGNEYKVFSSDVAGNLYVDGNINITGEYQINGYNIADFISPFLGLPGLVGFWPMSSVQRSTGNVYDLSGQGRTLTYNGNPTFNYTTTGVPYIDLDGTGDYLSRADETDLDILGTETQNTNPGLTMGGWFNTQELTPAAVRMLFGKSADTNGPYWMYIETGAGSTTPVRFRIRDNTDTTSYTVSATPGFSATSVWAFLCGRYTPSTEMKIWYNNTTFTNVTSIPAALLNGSDSLYIGGRGAGTNDWAGYATCCFLSANALSDATIQSLYQQTKPLFQ